MRGIKYTALLVSMTLLLSLSMPAYAANAGIATWYRDSKRPYGAATHLYPFGTWLRVTNTKTGKSVEVKVVSTWSSRNTKRVIDLSRDSFAKIASPSKGVVAVKLDKIKKQ